VKDVTPEQIHEDLRALRGSMERVADNHSAQVGKLNERITDLQVQVGGLQASRDFTALALQAMIRQGVTDALADHERRVTLRAEAVEKRLEILEADRLRMEGMTRAAKLGMTVAQLPGFGAALYLLGQLLGLWGPHVSSPP
jgi:hypothetical protein